MGEQLLNLLTRHPRWVLALLLALSLLALAGLLDPRSGEWRLQIDPSVDRLLPQDDPDRRFYEQVRLLFGREDVVILALATEDIFTAANIGRVERMAARLQQLPGVHRVVSLASVPNLRAGQDSLDVSTVADQLRAEPAAAAELRREVLANPLYSGSLVSDDGRTAAVLVYFKDLQDREFLQQHISERVREAGLAEAGQGGVWITGTPVIKAAITEALLRELKIAIPAMLLIGALFLLLVFRSLTGMLLPLGTILLALVWTLGTLAWLGRPLNIVTAIVPPLIISIGLAYGMHILSEYHSLLDSEDTPPAGRVPVRSLLASVALPLCITGVTTITGFLALTVSPLAAIKEFALLSALGVLYTMILGLAFLPATLARVGPRRGILPPRGERLFARAAELLARFNIGYRRPIILCALLLLGLSLWGGSRVNVGSHFIGDFSPEAPVRQQYEAISRAFGGANPFYVVVDGHRADVFAEPAHLAQIEKLQAWLAAQPEIASSVSLVDHIKLINRGLNDGDPAHYRVPDDRRLIKQLLAFGGGDELDGVVDARYALTNIIVRARIDDSARIAALTRRIENRLAALEPPLTARVTGNAVLVSGTLNQIAQGQTASLVLALGAIYLMMALMFTSWRAAALALLPNVLPIAVYFGALGLTGIPLNATTSLIACIVLGIAADDTIHYFVRFNTDARRAASETRAAHSALGTVLRPITYTAAILALGFLVLTTSELQNQVHFGALSACTLLVAWLANITLTPALSAGVRIVTLWDVVRLDLGRDPQHSIPLMDGLTLRQARTFALLSDIIDLRAGSRVLTDGDEGDDMYLVIKGQLRVWVQKPEGPVDLNMLTRGAVLGEIGYFAHKRTANVDAVTDVRLLRFNSESLERLRKRRPWIAALVYRNLNRAQAERAARAKLMR